MKLDANWPNRIEVIRAGMAGAGVSLAVACLEHRYRKTGVPHSVLIEQYGATDELIDHCRAVDILWEARPGCVVANPVVLGYPPDHQRPHIPLAIRREVMGRDGYQCLDCGATDRLSLDHVVPYSHGGPDTVENLRVLCQPCNSRKGNRV